MKKQIYSFIACIAVLSAVSCGNPQQGQEEQGDQTPKVKTIKVPSDSVVTYKKYSTSIEGINNSEARSKVQGYITEVLVDEGQKVQKGQVLFRLETESLSEEAEAAQANIEAAQVKVEQLEPLVEKEIVSKNELATAKAQLSQAKASYNSVMANIGYATVKSPVDGYVGTIRIRRGNLVSPSDPKPLTNITEINKVYAYFSMNEKDYLDFLKTADGKTKVEKVANMPEVELIMANKEEYAYKGKIETVNSQIGKESGSVSFRAVFDNPEQILTNGSTGTIKVPNYHSDVPIVPQKSTYERQGRTYVYKIQKTDSVTIAKSSRIHVLDEAKNLYVVGEGIEEGDEIVAEGADKLQSGQPVDPQEMPFDSIARPLKEVF